MFIGVWGCNKFLSGLFGCMIRLMRTKSCRARLCSVCRKPMKKNGHDARGNQRWACASCTTSRRCEPPLHNAKKILHEFIDWILSPCKQPGIARTFRSRVHWCWQLNPKIEAREPVRAVMSDGTYLKNGKGLLVLYDADTSTILAFHWCDTENTREYETLLRMIPPPRVLICDGMRGIEKACHTVWPSTRIQRCLVHVKRNARTDLTMHPKSQAGKDLKAICDDVTKIKTLEQKDAWEKRLDHWYEQYQDIVNEKTCAKDQPDQTGKHKRSWWWTHKNIRRCYRRMQRLRASGVLFTYLTYPYSPGEKPLPSTTNSLEGGLNSLIKRVLSDHRGMPREHQIKACEWYCYMRSNNPHPDQFLTQLHNPILEETTNEDH